MKQVFGYSDVFVTSSGDVLRIVEGQSPLQYSLWTDRDGYKNVTIKRSVNGKRVRKNLKVHRLVYQAFNGELIDGLVVCHLNGDPSDNRASNLVQATQAENHSHKKLHGTHAAGEKSPVAVHTNDEILALAHSIQNAKRDSIGRLWRGEINRLCKLHDVKRSTVRHLIHGEAWADTLANAGIEFPAITRGMQSATAQS